MAKGNAPDAKFRLGFVTVSVWKNDMNFYNCSLQRSYKDGDEFKNTEQLGSGDLLNAARLLQRAEEWISQQ